LRTRTDDILTLINYFYHRLTGQREYNVEKDALNLLLNYQWPGNIRELENLVERSLILGDEDQLTIECLPSQMKQQKQSDCQMIDEIPDNFDLEVWLEGIERDVLLKALQKSGGVRKKAAELLGISFRSIRYRLDKLDIGE